MYSIIQDSFMFYAIFVITLFISFTLFMKVKLSTRWRNLFSLNIMWAMASWNVQKGSTEEEINIINDAANYILETVTDVPYDVKKYNSDIIKHMDNIVKSMKESNNPDDLTKKTIISIASTHKRLYNNNSMIEYLWLEVRAIICNMGVAICLPDNISRFANAQLKIIIREEKNGNLESKECV